jgi:hypothetical protein
MQLKPSTDDALHKWLGSETWYTLDDFDMNLFYDFVNQYQKDHGFIIDEPALSDIIKRKIGDGVGKEIREYIRNYISIACNILDFLKHTGR